MRDIDKYKNDSDAQLLKLAYTDDANAVNELYNRHYVKALLYCIGKYQYDRSVAQDLVQDAFIQIYEKIGRRKGQKIENFRPYLFKVITNKARDYARMKSKEGDKINQIKARLLYTDHIDSEVNKFINDDFVAHILKELTDSQRDSYKMRLEGYSSQEIANKLGKSEDQVRGLLFRAKKLLKEYRKPINKLLFDN